MDSVYLTEIVNKGFAGPRIIAESEDIAQKEADKISKESNIELKVIGKLICEFEQFDLN